MVSVSISGGSRYPLNRKIVKKAVSDTLFRNKVENLEAEVSVYLVGKRKMMEISEKYLKDGLLHDVISFPLEDMGAKGSPFISEPGGVLQLGDIVLCWPQILISAAKADVLVDQEVYDLVCHSTEHLLGKHHEER